MTQPISGPGARRRAYRAPRSHVAEREPKPFSWRTVAVVLGIAVLGLYAWLWLIERRPVGVALIEIPLLLLLTSPLLVAAARSERRFDLAGLLPPPPRPRVAAADPPSPPPRAGA